jgi:hypothetical protein
MTRDTAAARAILVLSMTLTTYVVAVLVRALVHVADLPRRRRAARRSARARRR